MEEKFDNFSSLVKKAVNVLDLAEFLTRFMRGRDDFDKVKLSRTKFRDREGGDAILQS